MKLISAFHTEEAAQALRQRLDRVGIAVVVQTPVRIRDDSSPRHLVFAALASQHEDAVQCLENPKHWVKNRVDVKDFAAHLTTKPNRYAARKAMNRAFIGILLTLLLAVAAMVALMLN